jgi:hypothetical protein
VRIILASAAGLALAVGAAVAQTPADGAQRAPGEATCRDPGELLPGADERRLSDGETGCSVAMEVPGALSQAETDEATAASSSALVEASLAEADRRLANMKFVIGPPPRNMTKGRNPAP